jgi:murein DD-endopeptidase MepM/ murein hydrolase activator NlpD
MKGTVVQIAFPIPPTIPYKYRDTFLAKRDGAARIYNHVLMNAYGRVFRAHDGTDIYVDTGTPVVAPFSGTVVDPGLRLKPFDPPRYGEVVIIVSDEPTSRGYTAVMAHLSEVDVKVGQHVKRGKVVGLAGKTGNAEHTASQLHFELRTPFLIRLIEAAKPRLMDAFDPFPSLVRADPNR